MKKYKFCAVMLIAALLVAGTMFPIDKVSAAGTLQLAVDTVQGTPGNEVEIAVKVTDNPGICALRIGILYDSQLTLVKVNNGEIFEDYLFGNQLSASPYYLTWDESMKSNNKSTGVLATLTFKVNEDASSGLLKVSATCRSGDAYDMKLVDVDFSVSDGGVNVTGGNTSTPTPTTATPVPTTATPIPTAIVVTPVPTTATPIPTAIEVTPVPTSPVTVPTAVVTTPVPTSSVPTQTPTSVLVTPTVTAAPTATAAPTPTTTENKNNSKIKELTVESSNGKNSNVKFSVLSSAERNKAGKAKLVSITSEGKTVIIPDIIRYEDKSYQISSIGKNVLSENKSVTKVTISKSVTVINPNAFKNMKKLKTITINSDKITKVGKNAFAGIAKGATIRIKADKETYKKIKEMIEASGVRKGTKFKRVK